MPIDPSTVKWDDKPALDASTIKWDDAPKGPGVGDSRFMDVPVVLGVTPRRALGAARGVKDIVDTGAEYAAKLYDKATGGKEADRVAAMNKQGEADYKGLVGADNNNEAAPWRVAGQAVTTAPVGGLLGQAARGVGAGAKVVNGLTSGGFSLGTPAAATTAGRVGDFALRSLTGAATGGATVGLISPQDAGTGAIIGGLLPGATKVAGALGDAFAGAPLSAAKQAAVDTARAAGYKLPPTEINPNALNSVTEGLSGKIKTSQAASQKNQGVTNGLAAKALGLPEDTQLSHDVLNEVRKKAGTAYEAVSSTGTMRPGPEYTQALDKITEKARTAAAGFPDGAPDPLIKVIDGLKSKQFDAGSAVAKISELRAQADKAYRAGDNELGKGLKAGANALEDAIDSHLTQLGVPPEMLQGFREARKTIAKTYSVQKGLNNETGDVSASALAKQLEKGKPLSGELETIGKVASAFPKATQALKQNYNALSPLDFAAGMALHGVGGHLAVPLIRPAVRGAILSNAGQNFAARSPVNALAAPAYRALPRVAQQNGLLDTGRK